MLGLETGNQTKNRALATSTRSEKTNKFSFVRDIFDDERDILNSRKSIRLIDIVRLCNLTELDDRGSREFRRSSHLSEDMSHSYAECSWRRVSSSRIRFDLTHHVAPE